MDFIEFLDLDITNEVNKKQIMKVVFECINGLDVSGFNSNPIGITPTINKFVKLLNYWGLIEYESPLINLAKELSIRISKLQYLRTEKGDPIHIKDELLICKDLYKELFNMVTEAFIILGHPHIIDEPFSEFRQLYMPDLSNKRKAIELIEMAISCIESDGNLSERTKRQLINNLDNIISNLRQDKTILE